MKNDSKKFNLASSCYHSLYSLTQFNTYYKQQCTIESTGNYGITYAPATKCTALFGLLSDAVIVLLLDKQLD